MFIKQLAANSLRSAAQHELVFTQVTNYLFENPLDDAVGSEQQAHGERCAPALAAFRGAVAGRGGVQSHGARRMECEK